MEHLLSEVARVNVRPELLNSPLLKGKRKAELRREVIKDYIRRKPYGKRIRMQEIKDVGHFGTVANAYAFVKRMVAEGSLLKHEIGPRSFFYVVPGEVQVTKPAPIAGLAAEPEKVFDVVKPEAPKVEATFPLSSLEQKAMRYLYHYGLEGDNVRAFVKWLDSLED